MIKSFKNLLEENLKILFSSSIFLNTGIYTVSNVIKLAIPVLLLPIMTRYLTPYEYGIVAIFLATLMVMIPLVGLNIAPAIERAYVDYGKDNMARYIGTGFIILFFNLLICIPIFYLFRFQIGTILNLAPSWLFIIIVGAFCQVCISVILAVWRMEEKSLSYGFFVVAETLAQLGLALLLVVFLELHWQGRIMSIVASSIFFALVSLSILYFKGYIVFSFKSNYAKEILHYGVPLIPQVLATWVIGMSDRLFLNVMVGLEATGLYSVGFALGSIIGLFQQSFSLAWVPTVFKGLKQGDESTKVNFVRFTYLHNFIILLAALVTSLLAPFILNIVVGKDFQGAHEFVFFIAFGYAFNGMYRMVVCYISYSRKLHILSILTILTCFLNLALNYTLIKLNGAVGAAQATAISFFVLYVLAFWYSNRIYSMPWFAWFKK